MTQASDPAVDARLQTALTCHQSGRLDEANALYRQILEEAPGHAPTLHLRGVLLLELGQHALAIESLQGAVAADRARPEYRNDLGEAYRLTGNLGAAADAFAAILADLPDHAPAIANLGVVRHAQGLLDEANALYRHAIALDPANANVLTNHGLALLVLGQEDEARRALEAARALDPDNAAVALNLGNLELTTGKPEAAEALYREALALDPGSAAAQVNLGRALKEQGRIAEALSACSRARTMAPNLAAAHWNEALCRLLLGDFNRGWPGFLWRWAADAVPPHGIALPEWDGKSLAGRDLLVHAEQGLGDTLQFIRFLPLLAAFEPKSVTVLVQPELIGLVRSMACVDDVIGPDAPLDRYHCRLALLDLPGWLGLRAADFGLSVPYLRADPALVGQWQQRLGTDAVRRIGLVWKGRPGHANDRNRSMRLHDLLPLTDVPGTRWVSLQRETTDDEEAALAKAGIPSLGRGLDRLEETAALIMALDLVVTVDTSVAHLAGALGQPFWLMLPVVPDWRWMLHRADSPWYPSARLFRQQVRGDWPGVVRAIGDALKQGR
jgi:tetratricopeptide (TPR) repeat protein